MVENKEFIHQTRDIQPIPSELVINKLRLNQARDSLKESVLLSSWYSVNGDQAVVEVRSPHAFGNTFDMTVISDFDDTVMSATSWHSAEFQKLADTFGAWGVTPGLARELYEESKIRIRGKAEKESRYTPELNLILDSVYISGREDGLSDFQAREQARRLRDTVVSLGGRDLPLHLIRQDTLDVFLDNSPANFTYKDYIKDTFSESDVLKIIATRGAIEGLLGQIYKVHESGVMRENVGAVVYTNDLKSEIFDLLSQFLPNTLKGKIRVLDDNPKEIGTYMPEAIRLGLGRQLELIMVKHPDAKRRDAVLEEAKPFARAVGLNSQLEHTDFEPARGYSSGDDGTIYEVYKS